MREVLNLFSSEHCMSTAARAACHVRVFVLIWFSSPFVCCVPLCVCYLQLPALRFRLGTLARLHSTGELRE